MKRVLLGVVVAAAATAAGCQATGPEAAARRAAEQQAVERMIAARQGDELNQLCFSGQIDSWSPLGDDAILLRRGVNDWFKVDLRGACQPEWAFNTIALTRRPAGSSCLSRGDRIITDERSGDPVCYVDRIHEWDEDAPVPEPEDAAPTG